MGEQAHFKGEGGSIFLMDLPLPEVMQEKLTKGALQRVNKDGSPYVEPTPEGDGQPPERKPPAQSASKADLIDRVGKD